MDYSLRLLKRSNRIALARHSLDCGVPSLPLRLAALRLRVAPVLLEGSNPPCPGEALAKTDHPDHFFCPNGQKNTKPQGFTSLREAQLHSKTKFFFTSSLKFRSLACEVVSLRYRSISLVKTFLSVACEVFSLHKKEKFKSCKEVQTTLVSFPKSETK